LVVHLELLAVQVADAQRYLLLPVEWIGPKESILPGGAAVRPEEGQDGGFIRLEGEEASACDHCGYGDQDAGDGHRNGFVAHTAYDCEETQCDEHDDDDEKQPAACGRCRLLAMRSEERRVGKECR